ncbi:MAG TPA: zinc ribbon domain-containing protein [Actinobacteria bacterium]|nr:zinc ribbon domain-containing protein [Actinomycetota bacterium]
MPIYEFDCLNCENRFEVLMSVGGKDSNPKCPNCGKKSLRKCFSTFGFKSSGRSSASSCASCSATSCDTCGIK